MKKIKFWKSLDKKKKIRYSCYTGVVLLGIVGALVYFLFPTRYETEKAKAQNISETVEAEGFIKSNQIQTFYADWSVGIENLKIKEGDHVKKGDLLVAFNTSDLAQAVEQSEFQQKISSFSYQGAEESNEKWKLQLDNAAARISQIKGEIANWNTYKVELEEKMDTDIGSKAEELKKQLAHYEQLNADLNVEIQCFTHTEDTSTNLYQSLKNNEAKIAKIQSELDSLGYYVYADGKKTSLRDVENKLTQLETDLTQAETDWTTANTALQSSGMINSMQQSAELTSAIAEIDNKKLSEAESGYKAEFNGIVTEVSCSGGSTVNKGDQLFVISNSEDVCVQAEVSKYDIGKIEVGQTAVITLGDFTYDGMVSRISGVANAGTSDKPKVIVEVRINQPDEKIILGLKAHTAISVGEANQVLSIPSSAIYSDNQGDYCYAIEQGRIVRREITTGLSDKINTEIKEGLTPGAEVILDGITDSMIGERGAGK